jgi:hypothetical protein
MRLTDKEISFLLVVLDSYIQYDEEEEAELNSTEDKDIKKLLVKLSKELKKRGKKTIISDHYNNKVES